MEEVTFEDIKPMPIKEDFNYHTLIIKLVGDGDAPSVEVQCHGADKKDCLCDAKICQMREVIFSVGAWDVIRSAGDIELARLSARIDWSDAEEPWIDVEP